MKFSEVIEQASGLLQRKRRITYRALKLEFALTDEQLEVLTEELIDGQQVAVDEGGKVLVWKDTGTSSFLLSTTTGQMQAPAAYTPPHLAERILAEQRAFEARGATDGERKTITALFADLKGSTALIEGLDPEEARAIIDPALQLMMDAVHRYEGYVAQVLGDGIFALFGAPIAHEDHPQRALYAALRMQEEMRRYADSLRGKGYPPLLMRVGINTGEVVVRSIRKDDLHTDYVPVGHSTNLAARMEQLAAPGSILITEATYRLTEGYFACKELGKTRIKGVEEPLNIYEMLGTGPLRTRLQVSATSRGLSRFVGRYSELEQLQRALEQAKAGHGQIVGVMGEPGLGKSRLFYEFKLLSPRENIVLEAYSVSHGKASSYLPVIELLKSYFDIQVQDDERKRREKVIGKVLELDRTLEDTLPYLFALLGIEEQPSPLQQMDPHIRRRRTFEALKKLFLRESLNQPLILIFEDLHWIDNETQGLLDTLSEGVASARILLLVNYRPEYRHQWGQKTYYTQLRLTPLGTDDAEELLTFLLGNEESLRRLKRLILEKTEGNPFFMEEIVQELVEQGVVVREGRTMHDSPALPTDLHIPTTVQGVLAARIDRLATEEKTLLQQLAVLGREFPLSLVRQVVPQSEEEFYRVLSALQHKEFLYEQPAFPEVEYIFKHTLTQEVAYNSLLQEQRKPLHERTAQAIEVLYRGNLEDHYSNLAYHYSRSGNTKKAVEYLHLAGQQAGQRSAHTEAISHLTTALELLSTLSDTPGRAQHELVLQIALGPSLLVTRGPTASEVETAYMRARALCQQVGETSQLFPVLRGLCLFYLNRAELYTAQELGEQLLHLARREQDTALLLEAHNMLGAILSFLGELAIAREHSEQSLALYDDHQHRSLAALYGFNPQVFCLGRVCQSLWLLGYPERALQRSQEGLSRAQGLTHPPTMGLALMSAVFLHQLRREEQVVQKQAEAMITLCSEQGFAYNLAIGTLLRGWALAEQGHEEEGITQMGQGQAAFRAMGAKIGQSAYSARLADTYGKVGRAEDGLRLLAEALAEVQETGERFWEAELYRLKGTLTLEARGWRLETGFPSLQASSLKPLVSEEVLWETEGYFLKAIEVARKQQAKSWELRAATSLARLWQQQGKKAEAHRLLAEVYNWFTEGFDTKDLQEAKGLLEELGQQ